MTLPCYKKKSVDNFSCNPTVVVVRTIYYLSINHFFIFDSFFSFFSLFFLSGFFLIRKNPNSSCLKRSRCRHRFPRWRGRPCARRVSMRWRWRLGCRSGHSICYPGYLARHRLVSRQCLGRYQLGKLQRHRTLGCTWNLQCR